MSRPAFVPRATLGWLARVFVALLALLIPWPAHAESRVVLAVAVEGQGKGIGARALEVRVRKELEGRGFSVETLTERPAFDESRFTWLRGRAREASAEVGVFLWVKAETAYAELLVLDRVTGKSLVRNLPPAEEGEPVASTLALAAAELVEASLIEIQLPHDTMQPEVAAPADLPVPAVASAEEPSLRRWEIQLRPTAVWPIRLATPFAAFAFSAGVRPHARVLIELPVTVPVHPIRGTVDEAVVLATPFSFGLGLGIDVLRARAPVQLRARGAASVAPIRIDVTVGDENRVQQVYWTGLGGFGLAVRKEWEIVYVVADLGVDVPMVAPRLEAGGVRVLDLSPLWPRLGLGAGFRW